MSKSREQSFFHCRGSSEVYEKGGSSGHEDRILIFLSEQAFSSQSKERMRTCPSDLSV